MNFWDTSAVVPLLMAEPATASLQALAERGAKKTVWWATKTECVSAITRRLREATLNDEDASLALGRLRQLSKVWDEVEPSEALREIAIRFLRVHPLRAADALQLAAAFVASGERPSSLEVVTLDDRLAEAARKEGFVVVEVTPA